MIMTTTTTTTTATVFHPRINTDREKGGGGIVGQAVTTRSIGISHQVVQAKITSTTSHMVYSLHRLVITHNEPDVEVTSWGLRPGKCGRLAAGQHAILFIVTVTRCAQLVLSQYAHLASQELVGTLSRRCVPRYVTGLEKGTVRFNKCRVPAVPSAH